MINTTNIKITTPPSNHQTDPHKSRKSSPGHPDFGADINKALKKTSPKSLSQSDGVSQTNQSVKKKGHPFYSGSTPKGPFTSEKTLPPVSINRRDLALLKKILFHSGLSRKQVKAFLKNLAQGRPHEDINQTRFFQKRSLPKPSTDKSPKGTPGVLGRRPRTDSRPLEELDRAQFFQKRNLSKPADDKSQKNATVDPWIMLPMQTVLQRFGLTAPEINQAFHATRDAQGRLNWTQFVNNLKKIQNRSNNGIRITVDPTLGRGIRPKHESTGFQGLHPEKSVQISLNDFITSLERIRARTNPKATLAQRPQIETDRNAEKISLFEINHKQVSSSSTLAGVALSDPLAGPKPGRRKRPALSVEQWIKSKRETQPAAEGSRKISLSADNLEEGKQRKLDSVTLKNSPPEQPKVPQVKSVQGEASAILPADSGHQAEKNDVSEERHAGRAEVQKTALPDQVAGSTISKTTHSEKPPATPARSFLPAYVVDQVGKQIARSLLKGNRVIQLQLKPPDLGTIKVALDIQHDSLKLEMVIENSSVKELLKASIHELRASLVEQGVKLAKVDIQINYDFGQSASNSQESFKGPQQGRQGLNGEPAGAENEGEDSQTQSLPDGQNNHLLNLVA